MAKPSAVEDNIEGIFDAFFSSGAHHGDLHVLDLQGLEGEHDKQRIEQLLAELAKVRGVRVNLADAKVLVVCSGSVTDVASVLKRAGYVIKGAH